FAASAPAYTFNIAATDASDASLTVNGVGITNGSSNHPAFNVTGSDTHTATLTFASSSSADAILTANAGGTIAYTGTADGGTSAVVVNSGGTLTIAGLTDGGTHIGSLAGAGDVTLGANTLTVGSLNTDTEFSGVIAGTGGLIKTGTGTLALSGDNTYTGGTTIQAGTLQLGNGGTSGSITGDVGDNG